MSKIKTFQDFQKSTDPKQFIKKAVNEYKATQFYTKAVMAESYFKGENTFILARKAIVNAITDPIDNASYEFVVDLNRTKIPTNFFKRLIIQESGTLLNNGVQLSSDKEAQQNKQLPTNKDKLGIDFDSLLGVAGEKAKIHGKSYVLFNFDRITLFTALEFMPFYDERTGELGAGVRFWQIDSEKPLYMTLYEIDGYTEYMADDENSNLIEIQSKRGYKQIVSRSIALGEQISGEENYTMFPIVELKANEYGESELTRSLKEKIDRYDIILSDFGDLMERIKGIIWALQGFGGTTREIVETVKTLEAIGIIATQGEGEVATPHTMEVPHVAVSIALEILEKAIYNDYMGLNQDQITGGSLTNVAIRVAQDNLVKKIGRWKNQQVIPSVRKLLELAGLGNDTIDFAYDLIVNDTENDANIMAGYSSGLVDIRTAISKLSFIEFDEVDRVVDALALQNTGVPSIEDDIMQEML